MRGKGGIDVCVCVCVCVSVRCVNGQEKGEKQEQPCVETLAVSERGFHLGKDLGKDIRTYAL